MPEAAPPGYPTRFSGRVNGIIDDLASAVYMQWMDTQTFGQRILRLRQQRGESQTQAARALGVSKQLISQYETGSNSNPTLNTIRSLAAHYQVSAAFLIEGVN